MSSSIIKCENPTQGGAARITSLSLPMNSTNFMPDSQYVTPIEPPLSTSMIKSIYTHSLITEENNEDATHTYRGAKKPAQAAGRNLRLSRKGSESSGRLKP